MGRAKGAAGPNDAYLDVELVGNLLSLSRLVPLGRLSGAVAAPAAAWPVGLCWLCRFFRLRGDGAARDGRPYKVLVVFAEHM